MSEHEIKPIRRADILSALGGRSPMSGREISDAIGVPSNDSRLSAHLAILVSRGVIRVAGKAPSPVMKRFVNLYEIANDGAAVAPDPAPSNSGKINDLPDTGIYVELFQAIQDGDPRPPRVIYESIIFERRIARITTLCDEIAEKGVSADPADLTKDITALSGLFSDEPDSLRELIFGKRAKESVR